MEIFVIFLQHDEKDGYSGEGEAQQVEGDEYLQPKDRPSSPNRSASPSISPAPHPFTPWTQTLPKRYCTDPLSPKGNFIFKIYILTVYKFLL